MSNNSIPCVRCQMPASRQIVCEICPVMKMHCCEKDTPVCIGVLNEHVRRFHPTINEKMRQGRIAELRVKAIVDIVKQHENSPMLMDDFVNALVEILKVGN